MFIELCNMLEFNNSFKNRFHDHHYMTTRNVIYYSILKLMYVYILKNKFFLRHELIENDECKKINGQMNKS